MPKQIATTVSRNTSGEQVRATISSSGGISRRATTSTTATISAALASAQSELAGRSCLAAEHRDEQHHEHDRQVLEEQHAERDLAVAAVDLASGPPSSLSTIAVELSDTSRPVNTAARHSTPSATRIAGRRRRGEPDLQPAAHEDEPPDARQALEAELDADREQQQDDADLGGRVDQLAVADEAELRRPDDHAREQEADDRHEPGPVGDVGDDRAAHQQADDLGEERGGLRGGGEHERAHGRIVDGSRPRPAQPGQATTATPPRRGSPAPARRPDGSRETAWQPPKNRLRSRKRATVRPAASSAETSMAGSA